MNDHWGIITYNLQRHTEKEDVDKTVDVVNGLRKSYPNTLLCLQEVSSEVGSILEKHNHVRSDENMIIAPPGCGLLDESTVPGMHGSRSFLTCRFYVQQRIYTVLTGKLPHGILLRSQRARQDTFSSLLDDFSASGLIMALDTNALFPYERERLLQLAQQHQLSATHHPLGTYDLGLLEPKNLIHKFAGLFGRMVDILPELDFIFYDSGLRCHASEVIDVGNISDHKPVLARFN